PDEGGQRDVEKYRQQEHDSWYLEGIGGARRARQSADAQGPCAAVDEVLDDGSCGIRLEAGRVRNHQLSGRQPRPREELDSHVVPGGTQGGLEHLATVDQRGRPSDAL